VKEREEEEGRERGERRIKRSVSQLNDLLRPPQTIPDHNLSLAPHSSDVP